MDTTPTSAEGGLATARALGRQEAEALDLRLAGREGSEREARLTEIAWRPADERGTVSAQRALRLETRVEELTTYLRAVEGSLPWRLIQSLRRLVGRSW